jgi:hypothetical protein
MGIYSEIMEGSLGKNRVRRVFMSKKTPLGKGLEKVVNLTSKRALRGGADPKDVASRMTNPSANLRSVQGLQRFQDQARLKSRFPALRKEVQEATRSKYLKIYGKHKVGSDESKLNLARLKREMSILQRGGADAQTMKGAAAARGRYDRGEKPDPSYNPHDTVMAGYRFANMASRSKEAGKKSPRTTTEGVQLDELSLVKKALVKVRKSMRGSGVVGTAALAASNVAPNLWGGVSDADNEHRRKYGAKMRLRRKAAANGVKVQEAAVSKANKVYRKFGHGPEYNLASLKSSIATLRRGGASNETIRSYPAIHAQGGYHNKAEITTARSNFMARGMRKQNASPSWRAKIAKNANPSMTAEGVQRAVRLMNKVLKKNRPVTDVTVATKAYADFIGMGKRQAAKQQRRGGAPESVMKSLTPSAINTRIAAMRNFTETGRAKREAALKAKGKV